MLDTHAVSRSLTAAAFTPARADATTNAVRLAAEQGGNVTAEQFKAGLAEVRTEIAEVRTEIAHRNRERGDPAHPLDGGHGARNRRPDPRDPAFLWLAPVPCQ